MVNYDRRTAPVTDEGEVLTEALVFEMEMSDRYKAALQDISDSQDVRAETCRAIARRALAAQSREP